MKMIANLWHRFTRPLASDQDQARQEYTTKVVLTMMGVTLFVFTVPIVWGYIVDAFEPEGIVVMTMLDLAVWSGWGLAQIGKWRWARHVPSLAILFQVAYAVWLAPYSRSGILLAFLAVVLAALLLGKKAQWVTAALSAGTYLTANWIVTQDLGDLVVMGISLSAAFTGLSLLLWLLITLFEQALDRSRTYAAELHESNEKLRAMFMSVTDGITFADLKGIVIEANDAVAHLHRYPDWETLIGKNISDLFASGEHERVKKEMQQLLETGSTGVVRYRLLRADGTEFDGELNGAVVRDQHGQPRGFVVLSRDISERVQAEEERTRLATAIEQAGESVLIADTAGVILYVNPAFERASGYSLEEVAGQKTPIILQDDKQDAAFYQELWTMLQDGKVWHGRRINRKKDGTFYTEDATISPVRDETGQIRNYVSVARDISQELDLLERYHQAQKMEAVGRLASGIAHDFNNLLTAVQGYTRLLLDDLDVGGSSDPFARQMMRADLNQILEAANRAAALTRQLLAFSRKQVLQPQIINLNTILAGMEGMLGRLIGEHIELVTVAAPDLAAVRADPNQIEQVIMNLAVNARDAMPTGGRLTFQTENAALASAHASLPADTDTESRVVLSVSDTGVGMSPEVRAHLFEPFFTTKPEGKGTGLGLATVYGIVEQSSGHIEVQSEPGAGTVFRIYLPAVQDQPIPDRRGQPAEALVMGMGTILLVEDEDPVRELARRILERSGYTVLSASRSQEAWALSTQYNGEIELLITDVVMPGGGGRELAAQITAQHPEVKVLYISGYTDDAVLHDRVREAHSAFLQKPFTPASLAHKVREVLAERVHEDIGSTDPDPGD